MTKRHPPFCPGPAEAVQDFLSYEGARRLGEMVQAVWRRAGHEVPFYIDPVYKHRDKQMFAPRFPTLVGGLHRP